LFLKSANVLKVSALKFWLGEPCASGYFSKGLASLSLIAGDFVLSKNQTTSTSQSQTTQQTAAQSEPRPQSDKFKSPNNIFYKNFFSKKNFTYNSSTELEGFKNDLQNDISKFTSILKKDNFTNIPTITSTKEFWINHAKQLPTLFKLAQILLNINSSSACIERFFSMWLHKSKQSAKYKR
jgi:hypothetical protein